MTDTRQLAYIMNNYSVEELEKLLAEKQKSAKKEYEAKKKNYETDRNIMVAHMIGKAKELQKKMIITKVDFMKSINNFKEVAESYSDIRSNSKGGFSIRSADNSQRVVYERNVKHDYDERAKQAENLIKDFLADTVKKADQKTYNLIVGLLEKNGKGEYSTSLIAKLLKHEDEFNDARWTKAMQLFKESYVEVDISYSLSFYEKDENSKDKHISLSFSSL